MSTIPTQHVTGQLRKETVSLGVISDPLLILLISLLGIVSRSGSLINELIPIIENIVTIYYKVGDLIQ
jgi:hypothetical protein